MSEKSSGTAATRPLSREEIDRRIDAITGSICDFDTSEPLSPQWVTAAELVRRVHPLLSHN